MEYLIEENTEDTMNAIGKFINGVCGPKYGFVTLVFEFKTAGNAGLYVSNANRKDMIRVLRDRANEIEQGVDIVAMGEGN